MLVKRTKDSKPNTIRTSHDLDMLIAETETQSGPSLPTQSLGNSNNSKAYNKTNNSIVGSQGNATSAPKTTAAASSTNTTAPTKNYNNIGQSSVSDVNNTDINANALIINMETA